MADCQQVCKNSGSVSEYRKECHDLLLNLKTTVEGLLALPCTNVWQTYGGLDRVANKVELILSHRLKTTQSDNQDVFWHFIRGLRWLNPSSAPSIDQLNRNSATMKGQRWLRENLERHNLSSQLNVLIANRQHLLQHYHAEAFLCQPDYLYAMLVCLHAIEQNNPALLAEINPAMLHQSWSSKKSSHVRSNSLPFIKLSAETSGVRLSRPDSSQNLHHKLLVTSKEFNVTRQPLDSDGDIRLSLYDNASLDMLSEIVEPDLDHVIERINDPLMNFYATSSTEKLKRSSMKLGLSISSETLDTLGGLNVPLASSDADPSSSYDLVNSSCDDTQSINAAANRHLHQKCCEDMNNDSKTLEEGEDSVDKDSQVAEKVRQKVLRRVKERDTGNACDRLKKYDFTEFIEDSDSNFLNSMWTEGGHAQRSDHLVNIDLILNNEDLDIHSVRAVRADSGIGSLMSQTSGNSQKTETSKNQTSQHKSQSKIRSGGEMNFGADLRFGSRQQSQFLFPDGVPSSSFSESLSGTLSSSLPSKVHSKTEMTRQSGFFRAPLKGQSLLSFLSSQDFHTCTDLERERAHFSIAEALIAAIEQMKWNQTIAPKGELEHEECDSDEEIQLLKQRIRIRRSERLKEKARHFPGGFDPDFEVVDNGSGEISHSDSFPSFESLSPEAEYSSSSEGVQDAEINDIDEKSEQSNLVSMKDVGLSLSLASLYSDADIRRSQTPMSTGTLSDHQVPLLDSLTVSGSHQTSADSIAISLLKQFSEKQLPKASELLWLVSERDAPQQLLPLPNSYPISPDDGENADLQPVQQNRLRGNLDWAPPRPQIISSIHPKLRQSVVIARQNHRCAGCGSKVEKGYVRRYRYCEYLGKYFCQCCHSNDRAYVPGRILRKWDFGKYNVSHFAHEFLKSIYGEPVFSVESKTTGLYQKVPALDELRELRIQLFYLAPFIRTCKQINKPMLDNIPAHWLTSLDNIHYYSLSELVQVKKKELLPRIKETVSQCITHVSQCLLCHGKGFVCEICRNGNDVIFPFEIGRVVVCPGCRAAFHQTCYPAPGKGSCPKCTRILTRKQQKQDLNDIPSAGT